MFFTSVPKKNMPHFGNAKLQINIAGSGISFTYFTDSYQLFDSLSSFFLCFISCHLQQ